MSRSTQERKRNSALADSGLDPEIAAAILENIARALKTADLLSCKLSA